MKTYHVDAEQGEVRLSVNEFLKFYNEGLPLEYPRASLPVLKEFKKTFPALFKQNDSWSLEQHRKKVMDWLPQYVRSLLRAAS